MSKRNPAPPVNLGNPRLEWLARPFADDARLLLDREREETTAYIEGLRPGQEASRRWATLDDKGYWVGTRHSLLRDAPGGEVFEQAALYPLRLVFWPPSLYPSSYWEFA